MHGHADAASLLVPFHASGAKGFGVKGLDGLRAWALGLGFRVSVLWIYRPSGSGFTVPTCQKQLAVPL